MTENSLVIKEEDISDLEKLTAEISPSSKFYEGNFESKLNFSNNFMNSVEHEGFTYIGEVTDLEFYTSLTTNTHLLGKVSLRKIAKHEIDGTNKDEVEWEVETVNRGGYGSIIKDGKPSSDIRASYRFNLISQLALNGIKVSDELVDTVFSPIEEALVEIYKKLFVKSVEGVVEKVYYGQISGPSYSHKPVTLLFIRGRHNALYPLGFRGRTNVMKCGDSVEVEFNNERIAHLSRDVHIPNADKTVVETINLEWYKIVSYKVKK